MTPPNPTTAAGDGLENSAKGYFETVYLQQYGFWKLPDLTTGAKLMTGGFAAILIGFARWHMAQSVEADKLPLSVILTLFFILLICGFLLFFDRRRVDGDYAKLVVVVCAGVTLGCGVIGLDRLVPWIVPVWDWAGVRHLSPGIVHLLVPVISATVAGFLLWLNTIFQSSLGEYFRDRRVTAWTIAIWATICVGIWLVIRAADLIIN